MEQVWNVFLVDDHNLFRDGIKYLLSKAPGIKISGEASDGHEFLEKLRKEYPDVVLMDISMPGMSGIEATSEAIKRNAQLKIIALTMHEDQNSYQEMLSAGAMGFVLKDSDPDDLIKAIHDVARGNCFFSPRVMSKIIKTYPDFIDGKIKPARQNICLSEREKVILDMISQGLSNKEISKIVKLSQRTVEGIRSNLLTKTGTDNSLKLVLFAHKNNLFEE
jgi:DNA-binding NarL/FixJ family response regulator